jgi:lipoprotein-anchoring transpeptidase ErfK/SrfK
MRRLTLTLLVSAATLVACHPTPQGDAPSDGGAMAAAVGSEAPMAPPAADAPRLGALAMKVTIHDRPTGASRRIGYLRLGATVAREAEAAGHDGCVGGWFHIYPRGYVCVGDTATLDLTHPLLRAETVRPDLSKPLPYKYGFVRAGAPLYMKIPNRKEQLAAEFGLEDQLEWWKSDEGKHANDPTLGANDIPLDANGVATGALGEVPHKSTDMSQGELFGGVSDSDPTPFWLPGIGVDRSIPNVSGFQVPPHAVFANRVRRHTGLAFVGSFMTGDDAFDRRFAITTDLRLVPVSKVKPDPASPWHGVAIASEAELPFAWVRMPKGVPVYAMKGHTPDATTRRTARRELIHFSGNVMHAEDGLYRETNDGRWLKASDLGYVSMPTEWPPIAATGEKWIDVSIDNQTLVLWEGKKPLYATLVSTGQDGMLDWKTTKSTIRGTFRIRSKHVTTTMDSDGKSAEGGDEGSGPAPAASQETLVKDKKEKSSGDGGDAPGAPAGAFELRDVPWVEYFEGSYALHAAYWHDVFGTPRSHGCINMSPIDAHRVFMWTDPPMPDGWHGVVGKTDTNPGTTIFIHR